jgi:hypothetical protein
MMATQITPSQTLRGPALIAALLALVLWAVFIIVMISRANSASEVSCGHGKATIGMF